MEAQLDAVQGEAVEQVEESPAPASVENTSLVSSFALRASAEQDMVLDKSLAVGAAAGRDTAASDSLILLNVVGRDLGLKDSAAFTLVAGNSAQLDDSGALIAASREVNVQRGVVGIVIAQKANLSSDSKVLLNTKQAAIFGAAFGATCALLGWLLRKK